MGHLEFGKSYDKEAKKDIIEATSKVSENLGKAFENMPKDLREEMNKELFKLSETKEGFIKEIVNLGSKVLKVSSKLIENENSKPKNIDYKNPEHIKHTVVSSLLTQSQKYGLNTLNKFNTDFDAA